MQRNEAALLVQRVRNWDRVERRAFYTSQSQFGRNSDQLWMSLGCVVDFLLGPGRPRPHVAQRLVRKLFVLSNALRARAPAVPVGARSLNGG
jgi:hypothetical protein